MKNTMKKLMAALLALTCLPVMRLTASAAETPWYYGSATWQDFEDAEPINDHGMLTGETGMLYVGNAPNEAILVKPRTHIMSFVLRRDVDIADAVQKMAESLDRYFPGLAEQYKPYYHEASLFEQGEPERPGTTLVRFFGQTEGVYLENGEVRMFNLYLRDIPEQAEELESEILLDFAKKHLISEFYGLGETADYQCCYAERNVLEAYPENLVENWDSVQAYLAEHYPAYTLEHYAGGKYSDGTVYYYYRINGVDDLSFREKVELGGELYEQFGIWLGFMCPETSGGSTAGHNALEQAGDVNLDCEKNILDVIAANKYIIGVGTLDKTGIQNADTNGNGDADAEDALAILKQILEET